MKKIALYSFSVFFITAGIGHFILDSVFIALMPEWVPYREVIVYISGVMEIVLAIGLLFKQTRRKTGMLIVVFLILIFPVNIYMALKPEEYDVPAIALWLRLPFQFIFIWWVLKIRKYD